jgi:hypothetical protein
MLREFDAVIVVRQFASDINFTDGEFTEEHGRESR